MMQASSTAKMALLAQQTRLDTVANNMSNVNTAGFRTRQVTFADMLYAKMVRPTGNQEVNLQKGTGVLVAGTDLTMTQGIAEMTGVSLDFMIDGDGMFAVRSPSGETLYTRNGTFGISVEEDASYLVSGQGYYVLDTEGERIELPEGAIASQIAAGQDGSLSLIGQEPFATLGLYWFPNPAGLDSEGSNCFRVCDSSGEAVAAPGGSVILQGYLEAANVNMAMEMVNMVKTSRAFSLAARCITTADEMAAQANNMRA